MHATLASPAFFTTFPNIISFYQAQHRTSLPLCGLGGHIHFSPLILDLWGNEKNGFFLFETAKTAGALAVARVVRYRFLCDTRGDWLRELLDTKMPEPIVSLIDTVCIEARKAMEEQAGK